MSSTPQSTTADAAVGAGATGGDLLRAARESAGLRLDDIAASLKVPRRKLESLEGNRYDELPNPTFTRALALSVCRVLKIDAEPVLARLPRAKVDELAQVSLGLNEPFRDRFGGADGIDWRRFANLPMLGGLVLVVGAALVYWMPSGLWPKIGSAPATRVSSTVVEPSPAGSSATEADGAATAATTTTTTAASEAAVIAAPPTVAVDTVFSAPATPASTPLVGGVLMLRAAAESWVEVRDAAGRVLLSRSLAAGEATGLDGALPLRVVIGNAEATQITFKGQPVALGASRDNVARLELK